MKLVKCIEHDILTLIVIAADSFPFKMETILNILLVSLDKLKKGEDLSGFLSFLAEYKDHPIAHPIYEMGILYFKDVENLFSLIIENNLEDYSDGIIRQFKLIQSFADTISENFDVVGTEDNGIKLSGKEMGVTIMWSPNKEKKCKGE
ncbi:hypothetical protein LCGC14_0174620 [marine sediment metagenome]|uniref:Uncharacterized protein n=1 Tax=marine sediment metagenome TaxID=412755 RepID=A0A0F9XTG7_9ZZZZ